VLNESSLGKIDFFGFRKTPMLSPTGDKGTYPASRSPTSCNNDQEIFRPSDQRDKGSIVFWVREAAKVEGMTLA
jgi:hypothetical protein